MARPRLEVADVFRARGAAWRKANEGHVSRGQMKVMSAIESCRTAALGGHVERCEDCAHTRIAYNSCLMGKIRNGESAIEGALGMTAFCMVRWRFPCALLPISMIDIQRPGALSVLSSGLNTALSAPASRLYPTTSAAKIAVSFRVSARASSPAVHTSTRTRSEQSCSTCRGQPHAFAQTPSMGQIRKATTARRRALSRRSGLAAFSVAW